MKHLKAFVSGLTLPAVLLPFIFMLVTYSAKELNNSTLVFMHFIPVIWGIWNVLYFAFFRNVSIASFNEDIKIGIWGAILGLLLACIAIFWFNITASISLHIPHYLPLIIAPILYAILWRYIVKKLNDVLGVGRFF